MINSVFISTSLIALAFFGCVLNIFGILITKFATSAHRATISQVKVVSIWIFFLLYSGYGTQESFLPLQFIGFTILVGGVVIFNEILEIPFLGFNMNTKRVKICSETSISTKIIWDIQDDDTIDEECSPQTLNNQLITKY